MIRPMWLSRPRVWQAILVGSVMVMAGGVAFAQIPQGAPDGPQVYLDDSFAVAETIAKAQGLVDRARWAEAAELLQRTSIESGDKLVQVGDGRFTSVRNHINGMLCSWPPEGRKAYRTIFDSEAKAALASASDRRDVAALYETLDRYFCLPEAAEAADVLGQLALEAGYFAMAERVYLRVLDDHPSGDSVRTRYEQRLVLLRAMLGQEANGVEVKGSVRWKGTDRDLASALEDIRGTFQVTSVPDEDAWPMLGGNIHRNRIDSIALDELGLLWRFELAGEEGDPHGLAEFAETRGARRLGRRLGAQPIVAADRLFVQFHREIYALHRTSGMVLWRYGFGENRWLASEYDDLAAGVDAPAFDGERIFAVLPGSTSAIYGAGARRTAPALVCLNARDGRVNWIVERSPAVTELADIEMDGTPLVHQGSVSVIGRRRRSFGFEDCYLFRFDANSGRLLSRTHLGSASTGSFGTRQATLSMLAAEGDTIFAQSNLGTIAAVDAHSGRIRWLRVYERSGAFANREASWGAPEVEPWALNPVIVENGRLVVLPLDSPALLWISAEDGSLLRSVPTAALGSPQTLLGVRAGVVCTAGEQVGCFDLSGDRPLWQASLPKNAEVFGRGQWCGEELLVPAQSGLSRFDVSTGSRLDVAWTGGELGGNLVSLPDQLLVSGVSGLTSYVRKEELWRSLRAAMAARPDDPQPALDAAEVALRSGDFDEAVAYLLDSVRRADSADAELDKDLQERLFNDILSFSETLKRRGALSAETLDRLFGIAPTFAPDIAGHLRYRLLFAMLFESTGRAEKAIDLYQQILRDRSLRGLAVSFDTQGLPDGVKAPDNSGPVALHEEAGVVAPAAGEVRAAVVAENRIAALLREHGRAIYADHEAEARRKLEAGKSSGDVEMLADVAAIFPNAEAAFDARLAQAERLRARGQFREAAAVLETAWRQDNGESNAVVLLRAIADAYEQAGEPSRAFRWLTMAMRQHMDTRFPVDGRPTSFREYRERLADVRMDILPARPQLDLPLDEKFTHAFPDDIRLLTPRFSDAPRGDWSRYFVYSDGALSAFDSRTHREVWPEPQSVRPDVELLVARPEAIVLSTRFQVLGLDPVTGKKLWSHGPEQLGAEDPDADWENFATIRLHALHGDRLVFADDRGLVRCVDIRDGRLVWSASHRPTPERTLVLGDAWVLYTIAQDERVLVGRLDANTGEWLGSFSTLDARPVEELLATLDGDVVVVTSQSIAAFDGTLGTKQWEVPVRGHVRQSSLLLDVDTLYFCDDGRAIRKLRLSDGVVLWESEPLSRRTRSEVQIERRDSAIIAAAEQEILTLDETSGVLLWQGTTPDGIHFVLRAVTEDYVAAVHFPEDEEDSIIPEATAFFYDLRNNSGVLATTGGMLPLGPLDDVSSCLVVDGGLIIQVGRTIRAWSHVETQPSR